MEAGWGCRSTVIFTDLAGGINVTAFFYFCSVAYDYYQHAAEDPEMIDQEYSRLASEKKDQVKRKKEAEMEKKNKGKRDEDEKLLDP